MNPPELIPSEGAIFNTSIFAVFVLITLFVVYRASSQSTSSDYFAAGGSFSGAQNGIALSGDFLSAASFLGIAGAIAVHGYDGFLYSIGFLVAWLINLLLLAERTRNTGRFTMGDVIAFRMRARPVRAAAAASTLAITFVYLIAQMAGAGGLVALLLDVKSTGGQALVIAVVGLVMMLYVLVGGMKGTTWVQIIKATMLLLCAALITIFLLGKFGYSMTHLLQEAAQNNPKGDAIFAPGVQYGKSELTKIDFVSLSLALVLGVGGLPHVLMRFYTVPNAREARRSSVWAIWAMTAFYLCTLIIGYGAAALVGTDAILDAPGAENSAAPLLAYRIGGTVLLGIVSAVAFATILAVVAGLTLTASASFAHDIYANAMRRGRTDSDSVVRVARITALVIGAASILGGILVNGQNIAFLVGLAFAFAASANLSTILYSLFWKRFNTTGTLWGIYSGLISCLLLVIFSPVVSGASDSIFPSVDFAFFPLKNPGIVSIPISFICGIIGTFVGREKVDEDRLAEMEVRQLTGIGGVRG
ncbi:cation/acetate symporter [Saccharopolyspora erythraea NRRL 2338]|uniref:SSS sodium solute transporter superfamily n=2 Tax=Saccharopolyspora erythraea TaxID=1836 RepID=A4F7K6_SACEN|nr:cation acetate symporter [Saccharopolyspora erythraea]EQD87058.1 acetate permease [Saccharopolyspora erythraea D]PFG93833.1 cation/acetate symporter [Saccharopolyspora erythraea NRRL 2338]QRK90660.1 cation acetate symporter [Saccharopolyspora erythraea]CAM00030.1 SSS sodium solute transporter superfamily [Saccharopolyspora erythraea NRRL 2338]